MATYFYINLDRSVKRNEMMQSQLERLKINARRVSAVDGRKLPRREIKKALGTDVQKKQTPWLGAIGCFLSHHKVYQIMEAENIPAAMIMEDDLIIEEPKPGQIISEIENLQEHWNIVHMTRGNKNNYNMPVLKNRYSRKKLSCGYLISKYWWKITCTGGYMITRDYACRLLEEQQKLDAYFCRLDDWLFSLDFATCWPHLLYKHNPQNPRQPHQPFARPDLVIDSTVNLTEEEKQMLYPTRTRNNSSDIADPKKANENTLIPPDTRWFRRLQAYCKIINQKLFLSIHSIKYILVELLPWTDRSLPAQLGLRSIFMGADSHGELNFWKRDVYKYGKRIKVRVFLSLVFNIFRRG